MTKRILCLLLVLMMIASSAMAMNKDRFLNESDVSIDENGTLQYGINTYALNTADPDFCSIFMAYVEGYIVVYMGHIKNTQGYPTAITITTDEQVYSISACTDPAAEFIKPSSIGFPLLVNEEVANMFRDISTSDTCTIIIHVLGTPYKRIINSEQKHMLALMADEYSEVIAPLLNFMPDSAAIKKAYAVNKVDIYSSKK